MNQPTVYTLILTWNSKKYIDECINSVLNSTYKTKLIVIDNNSSDGTEQYIKNTYKNIDFIQTGSNLGYAGGNNIGINLSIKNNADYIFILNPDAYIATDCLKNLIKTMEKNLRIAMASPKIYFKTQPNRIWFAGSKIDWKRGISSHIGNGETDSGQYDKSHKIDRICGCAVLIRANLLKEIGYMDEKYFLYFEETDWSVRFTEKGHELYYVADAHAWHNNNFSTGSFSNPVYEYYITRNRLIFMKRFRPKYFPIFYLYFIFDTLISFMSLVLLNNKYKNIKLKYITKGLWDFNLGRSGNQSI